MTTSGQIVILNGAPRSGKSSQAAQAIWRCLERGTEGTSSFERDQGEASGPKGAP